MTYVRPGSWDQPRLQRSGSVVVCPTWGVPTFLPELDSFVAIELAAFSPSRRGRFRICGTIEINSLGELFDGDLGIGVQVGVTIARVSMKDARSNYSELSVMDPDRYAEVLYAEDRFQLIADSVGYPMSPYANFLPRVELGPFPPLRSGESVVLRVASIYTIFLGTGFNVVPFLRVLFQE